MSRVRVFKYLDELDAFILTPEFNQLAEELGLTEWHPVVWMGRLFMLDNDFGEHWFDNWDEREAVEEQAKAMGINTTDLMFVVPWRFQDGRDGPCHSDELRKAFWTDVLKCLEMSYEVLFGVARHHFKLSKEFTPEDAIEDLEERINKLRKSSTSQILKP